MEEAAIIEQLILFGLSRQEAAIYLCLLQKEELTGYEVAKLTGISRSNVYNGLASLVEHGAAYVIEGSASKYLAVSLEEFCDNRLRYLTSVKDALIASGPKKSLPREGYITIEGYDHICDKIRHMLLGAEKRIYFSATGEFLEQWSEEIRELVRAQKKVVLISEDNREPFPEDAELKAGIIEYLVPEHFREPEEEEQQMDQIRLIIDSEHILTGTVTGKSSDTCLYSGQKNFVRVFKDAMRNEIALIRLKQGEQ